MKKTFFKIAQIFCVSFCLIVGGSQSLLSQTEFTEEVKLSKQVLLDKIKGGWAGQTIGVTFGAPTEFAYQGSIIEDYVKIPWHAKYVGELMDANPGIYDDIYMDLTFVDVIEKHGIDAPVNLFAKAFAEAEYPLWHANQAARYNVLQGVENSGHWLNNPHADDIDYQIEADFAGLMSPGMPNAASEISDKIGHIMTYGDGWYGGVYVGAMYSIAFFSDDIHFVVTEALKTIPKESRFYKVIDDVIKWHKMYPDDWKKTWYNIQHKHSDEIGCPQGVMALWNIEAPFNAAYIVLGLLYGDGNMTRTLEISTRAGQDSDCNPSNAAGILGTMMGYSNIPEYWMQGLEDSEDKKFKYTTLSLNDVYDLSFKHALEMIKRNGGTVKKDDVIIKKQSPQPVKLEQSFPNMYPVDRVPFYNADVKDVTFDFEGTGFILLGEAKKRDANSADGEFKASLYIDGVFVETAVFPTSFLERRYDVFWKYQLPNKKHTVRITVDDPSSLYLLETINYVVYSDKDTLKNGWIHPE